MLHGQKISRLIACGKVVLKEDAAGSGKNRQYRTFHPKAW
jgi:hypothetical protein